MRKTILLPTIFLVLISSLYAIESDSCTPNWLLDIDWTVCNADGLQFKYYYDANNCYAQTGLVSDKVVMGEEQIILRSPLNSRCELRFIDGEGYKAKLPLVYTSGSGNLKLGDSNYELILKEKIPIKRNRYFFLNADNGKTYALQYKGADRSTTSIPEIKFKNLATGEEIKRSYDAASGTTHDAEIRLGGETFNIYNVSDDTTANFDIFIDLNGDGELNNEGNMNIEIGNDALIGLSEQPKAEDPSNLSEVIISLTTPYIKNSESPTPEVIYKITEENGKLTLAQLDDMNLETLNAENSYGYTKYRTLVRLYQPQGSNPELYITYPETQICTPTQPESVPTKRLIVRRYADIDGDGIFETRKRPGKPITDSKYTLEDTYGYNCEQILELKPGKNKGEKKFGCTKRTIRKFIRKKGWAKNLLE